MTDAILVRAPVGVVYRTLTDLDGWPLWLGRSRSVRLASDGTAGDRHALVLPDGRRRWRLAVTSHGWRHDLGMHLRVHGSLVVTGEWWLDECREGVVEHQLVRGDRRAVGRMRRAIGLGLQAFKDHAELAVAVAVGRVP